MYAPNLDRAHEVDVIIGLKDWLEDLVLMPSLCICTSYETFRLLSSTFSDVRTL